MNRLWMAAVGIALAAGAMRAADPAEEKTGIKVGQTAPEFSLKDQGGAEVRLKDLRKEHLVAIVFHRSAGW